MPKSIDRAEVQRLINQGGQVVDVLPRKINLPLKLINHDTIHQLQKEKAVIVYCYDYQ
jgi:hypothetical protein